MDEFDILLKELDTAVADVEEAIMRGDPVDYPAYRELVGKRQGLQQARQVVEDTREQLSRQEPR